ncbi:aminopeptidase N [Celerinatantimonas sp. MCCC 1A17872]|uniref:aminopeptidase N n=1 Tax=Celerinatantimonas sp. MCCC 1A17872 TaxID=3177514 RepID=UPI0038C1CD35
MSTPVAKYRKDYIAPGFTTSHIDLDVVLDDHQTKVTAVLDIKQIRQDEPLHLDGDKSIKLIELLVDGEPYTDYSRDDEGLSINGLGSCQLTIVNEIDPKNNTALEGLYKSGDAFCTQCEAEGFRRITFYQDRPDVLATFTTRVEAPKADYPFLLSNGNKIESGELEGDRHWVLWQDPFPKPSYLFALVAGDFDKLSDSFKTRSGRDVALEIFVDKGNLHRAHHAMESLQKAMAWDESRFSLEYDLDIYMVVAVDFFNMGAMENKGLNVFNSKYVLASPDTATDSDYMGIESVIGHEYFHNWTGDRVTCRDWFQLSLKEGLTVFRDQEFSSDLNSRAVERINNVRILRSHQFAEDAGPMAHPIRPEKVIEMNNFYTLTVYEKGAEVIRMMHTLLGEAKFQAGMALYFERHDGQAVTCDDFVQAMEDASGIDLGLFRRWYSQSGTPHLSVKDSYDASTQRYTLTLAQMTPATADQSEKLPLHIPVDIELLTQDGKPIELKGAQSQRNGSVLNLTDTEQSFVFESVASEPTPCLLQQFSAPVKLFYDYSDEQLLLITQKATDSFCRWDALQQLVHKYVRLNVVAYQERKELTVPEAFVDVLRAALLDPELDPAFTALLFNLPSTRELIELFDCADIDAIEAVRFWLQSYLAEQLEDEVSALITKATGIDKDELESEQIGWRSLKAQLLKYAAFRNEALIEREYQQARTMTMTLADLNCANQAQLACRDELMRDFEQKWQHDGLVMDKWFTLQGTYPGSDVLQRVKALLNHPSFSLSNPNRTRSLVGSFCEANPVAFHREDGSGYEFLRDILLKLNESNPQVAARLVTPLIQFGRLDQSHQSKIKEVLTSLAKIDNISRDLYEKIDKALSQFA